MLRSRNIGSNGSNKRSYELPLSNHPPSSSSSGGIKRISSRKTKKSGGIQYCIQISLIGFCFFACILLFSGFFDSDDILNIERRAKKKHHTQHHGERREIQEVKEEEQPQENQQEIEPIVLSKDSIYSDGLSVPDIHGDMTSLAKYAGYVTLVVNVACAWGFTDVTYKQLSTLQTKYADKNFSVLAFPTNDFRQETGTNEEIENFVKTNYPDAQFPIFAKSALNDNVVYQRLKTHLNVKDKAISWNFNKYLVNREGMAIALYDHSVEPFSIENDIVALLGEEKQRYDDDDEPEWEGKCYKGISGKILKVIHTVRDWIYSLIFPSSGEDEAESNETSQNSNDIGSNEKIPLDVA